jgi:hypothetical protein
VPDVLAVAALEQRHPVPHLVMLEADYGALHPISLQALRPVRAAPCVRPIGAA